MIELNYLAGFYGSHHEHVSASNYAILETTETIESLSREMWNVKMNQIDIFKRKKHNNQHEKPKWLISTAEWREERKESVNVKTEQEISPNLNRRVKLN